MQTEQKSPERPTSITVVCILGFIGAAITVPTIFSSVARQIGSWYPPYLALCGAIGLACMVGLWKMKKWAVFTYGAFVALNQVVLIAGGIWSPLALILPGIVVAIGFANLSKMS